MMIRLFIALLLFNFNLNSFPYNIHTKGLPVQDKNLNLKDRKLAWNPEDEQKECSVCLEATNMSCIELPCKHKFHENCIYDWFNKQLNCPNCRYDFKDHPEILSRLLSIREAKFKKLDKKIKKRNCFLSFIHTILCLKKTDSMSEINDISNQNNLSVNPIDNIIFN